MVDGWINLSNNLITFGNIPEVFISENLAQWFLIVKHELNPQDISAIRYIYHIISVNKGTLFCLVNA